MYIQIHNGGGRKANLPEYRKRVKTAVGQRKGSVAEDNGAAGAVQSYLLTRFRKRRNDAFRLISREDYRDIQEGVTAFATKKGIMDIRLPETFGPAFFDTVREKILYREFSNVEYMSVTEEKGRKCLKFGVRDYELDCEEDYLPLVAGGIWRIPNRRLAQACKAAIRNIQAYTPLTPAWDCVHQSLAEYILEQKIEEEDEGVIWAAEEVNTFLVTDNADNGDKYKELKTKSCPREYLEQEFSDILADEQLTEPERDLASYILANIDVFYTAIEEADCYDSASVLICESDFFPILINDGPNLIEASIFMTSGETVAGDMILNTPLREAVILPDGEVMETGNMKRFRDLIRNLSEKLSEF